MTAPLLVNQAQLRQLAPRCDSAALAPLLSAAAGRYDIGTPLRLAHWLAQAAFESEAFSHFEEDLDYTIADLRREWPGRFPDDHSAAPYAHNPPALANSVYGARMGNNQVGDGWTYRGRGFFDITGRDAYAQIGLIAGKPYVAEPALVAALAGAADSAGAFWRWKGLNVLADADDIQAVTRRVNGGLSGLTDRQTWLRRTKAIWLPA